MDTATWLQGYVYGRVAISVRTKKDAQNNVLYGPMTIKFK